MKLGSWIAILLSLGVVSGGSALNVAVDVDKTCHLPKTASVKFSDVSFHHTTDLDTLENYCRAVNMHLATSEDIKGASCVLHHIPKNYRIHSKVLIRVDDEKAILEPYNDNALEKVQVPLFSHESKQHKLRILCVKDVQEEVVPETTTDSSVQRKRSSDDTEKMSVNNETATGDIQETQEQPHLIKRVFNIIVKQQHKRGDTIKLSKRATAGAVKMVRLTSSNNESSVDETPSTTTTTSYKNQLKVGLEGRRPMTSQNRNASQLGVEEDKSSRSGFFSSLFNSVSRLTKSSGQMSQEEALKEKTVSKTARNDETSKKVSSSLGDESMEQQQQQKARVNQLLDTLKAQLYEELEMNRTSVATEDKDSLNETDANAIIREMSYLIRVLSSSTDEERSDEIVLCNKTSEVPTDSINMLTVSKSVTEVERPLAETLLNDTLSSNKTQLPEVENDEDEEEEEDDDDDEEEEDEGENDEDQAEEDDDNEEEEEDEEEDDDDKTEMSVDKGKDGEKKDDGKKDDKKDPDEEEDDEEDEEDDDDNDDEEDEEDDRHEGEHHEEEDDEDENEDDEEDDDGEEEEEEKLNVTKPSSIDTDPITDATDETSSPNLVPSSDVPSSEISGENRKLARSSTDDEMNATLRRIAEKKLQKMNDAKRKLESYMIA